MECTEQSGEKDGRNDGVEPGGYEKGLESSTLTATRSGPTPSTAKRFRSMRFMSPMRRTAPTADLQHHPRLPPFLENARSGPLSSGLTPGVESNGIALNDDQERRRRIESKLKQPIKGTRDYVGPNMARPDPHDADDRMSSKQCYRPEAPS